MSDLGIIERAYQLAPDCRSVRELRMRLKQEGYDQVLAHINGSITKQLTALMKA